MPHSLQYHTSCLTCRQTGRQTARVTIELNKKYSMCLATWIRWRVVFLPQEWGQSTVTHVLKFITQKRSWQANRPCELGVQVVRIQVPFLSAKCSRSPTASVMALSHQQSGLELDGCCTDTFDLLYTSARIHAIVTTHRWREHSVYGLVLSSWFEVLAHPLCLSCKK